MFDEASFIVDSNTDNEITLDLNSDALSRALKSAAIVSTTLLIRAIRPI